MSPAASSRRPLISTRRVEGAAALPEVSSVREVRIATKHRNFWAKAGAPITLGPHFLGATTNSMIARRSRSLQCVLFHPAKCMT